jgi:hypothetical protein
MFSIDGGNFVSILKVDEEGNFVVSVGITSIDKEPFISIIIIWDGVFDIFLDRLTLNIIRISSSDHMVVFNSHK